MLLSRIRALPLRRMALAASSTALCGGLAASCAAAPATPATPESTPPPSAAAATPPPASSLVSSILSQPKRAYEYASESLYDNVIKPYAEPSRDKLLPDLPRDREGRLMRAKPTLVLSLDGCLIQSLWSRQHGWRYIKRPGLDRFIEELAPYYELVLWTDAMNTAEPIIDKFDSRRRYSLPILPYMSRPTCHAPDVTPQMSHPICHTLYATPHMPHPICRTCQFCQYITYMYHRFSFVSIRAGSLTVSSRTRPLSVRGTTGRTSMHSTGR